MTTHFTHTAAFARDIERLRTTPGRLSALRSAGYANAARCPLSTTARILDELGRELA